MVATNAIPDRESESVERWQYPMEALRELVINMIIHRDYRSASSSIVKIFPDRVEFYNPGKLPDSISVDQLFSNDYVSTPRNILIANIFKEMRWIEKYGTGFGRVCEQLEAYGLPRPEVAEVGDGVRVTVRNVTDNGESRQLEILSSISKDGKISTEDLAQKLLVARRTILRDLQALKSANRIRRIGSEKAGHWEVVG